MSNYNPLKGFIDQIKGRSSHYSRAYVAGITPPFGDGAYGLLRVPAKYYIEIRDATGVLFTTAFPIDPSNVQISRANPISLTHTLTGTFREISQHKEHMITITGRTGLESRGGYNREGAVMFQDAITIFKEFDEMLKHYVETAALEFGQTSNLRVRNAYKVVDGSLNITGGEGPDGLHMILRCIDEDAHFLVEPMSFTYGRDTNTNRFDFVYNLQFRAYDFAYLTKDYPLVLGILDAVDSTIGGALGYVQLVDNVINNVSNDYVDKFRDGIAQLTDISKVIANTTNSASGLVNNISGIGSDLHNAVQSFGSVGDAWSNISGALAPLTLDNILGPEPDFESLAEQEEPILEVRTFAINSDNEADVEPPPARSEQEFHEYAKFNAVSNGLKNVAEIIRGSVDKSYYENRQKTKDENYYVLGEYLSNEENLSALTKGAGSSAITTSEGRNAPRYVYSLQKDDDLRRIALKFFQNDRLAEDIQLLNGWRDFRTKADGSFPEVGDTIFLPISGIQNRINPFAPLGDYFSTDLRCTLDDIELDVRGDLSLIGGIDNLKQNIKNILFTIEGDVCLYPKFGVKNININDPVYAAAVIREAVLGNPKILDVNNIVVEQEDDTLFISMDIKVIGNETIRVNAPIPG